MPVPRRLPIGAEPCADGGVHFRVWAPRCHAVEVIGDDGRVGAVRSPEDGGYFGGVVRDVRAGWRYAFRLDGAGAALPDPASRFQPDGPHGPSAVIDPTTFTWTDGAWRGVGLRGQVIYEMHVGTFTRQGTWRAAIEHLPALVDTGVSVLEVMPVTGGLDGAGLGDAAFVLRFFGGRGDDRVLTVNLGCDLALGRAPEPLLAPPEGARWEILWSSEHPRYGGLGVPALAADETWRLVGEAATLLTPHPLDA